MKKNTKKVKLRVLRDLYRHPKSLVTVYDEGDIVEGTEREKVDWLVGCKLWDLPGYIHGPAADGYDVTPVEDDIK